jgi:hypothetical protein
MATKTLNAHVDYFGLVESSGGALKITDSAENKTNTSVSGANLYGDITVVDTFGETAAPTANYELTDNLTDATMPEMGAVVSVDGLAKPFVLGGLSINTSTGAAPTVSASGQMVQAGATQLRKYTLPGINLTPRHRAQDFMNLCTIKKGTTAADEKEDYGLESVSANFPIEITTAAPGGEVVAYDLHGGMATCDFTMNWYADTAPVVELTDAATELGAAISPVSKSTPRDGYTQYTWQVSFPLVGEEVA